MHESMTPSQLRANLYRVLDQVLDSGQSVEIERKGRQLRIVADRRRCDLLKPHPGYIKGDPEALVHLDWSAEWRP